MSLFATAQADPHQAVDLETAADVPGNDPTPSPLPSSDELLATFFPSDAGGVGYLFEHGLLDSAPTPLEDVPVPSPDLGATAMSAVNEGINAHVSPMPDVPAMAGGATDVQLGETPVTAQPATPSTLKQTLAAEGSRLKALIARLGGPVNRAEGNAPAEGKKKGKKLKTPAKIGIGVGGALVLYLGYRYYENAKATAAAGATSASPADAAPDDTGTATPGSDGEIATGGATPGTESGDPLEVTNAEDSSGETYAQELADLEANISSENLNFSDIEASLAGITGANAGNTVSTGTGSALAETQSGSRDALIAEVAKATGLSTKEAGQQVALYLEGKPLTSKAAVDSIGNQVAASQATLASEPGFAQVTIPAPTLSKTVTQSNDSAAVAAQEKAEAVVKKDAGTAAETQALANEKRATATVASRK